MEEKNPAFFDRFNNWVKGSIMLKLFTIGIFILILLIPSGMISGLIYERQELRNDAQNEITEKWGGEQTLGGLVLTVPYFTEVKYENGTKGTETRYAHFLPDELFVDGKIIPEKRYRGIYVVMLYQSKLTIKGKFNKLKPELLKIPMEKLQFNNAFFNMGISDMKGINESVLLELNGKKIPFQPGVESNDLFISGISAPASVDPELLYDFQFTLDLNGSKYLHFLPLGKVTVVNLISAWPSPSFDGNFLPDQREISQEGFKASWKVLELNRNYPQQGTGSFISHYSEDGEVEKDQTAKSAFGVKLLLPIDEYQKTMRSAKYNVMFILLTFLTFFFVEVLNKKRIHPLQYLLIGFGIVLFYVLLLSISEHVKFDYAYLISSLAIIALEISYSAYILKNLKLTAIVGLIFITLYAFFYSLLQLEDYSLLFGSLGLLVILALIMYLTRNINWYKINRNE
ncbi:MAG: cell envelope integrity protein CreD [Bacteroidota bacterium]|nr:cell envelope integrity protein CreD [Bacteroidota bacterium]